MIHKYCIGLKKLPELHQKWLCDLCVFAGEEKSQECNQFQSSNNYNNLYSADNNCGTLRSQMLQNILKNAERHAELISSRRAENQSGNGLKLSGNLTYQLVEKIQTENTNDDLGHCTLRKRSTLRSKRKVVEDPPQPKQKSSPQVGAKP